jgi:flagellar assembly protein FliH
MASKLIKQGTSRSLEIQQFLFSENCVESHALPEQVHWPELPIASGKPQKAAVPTEPPKPEIDLTSLERNAYENGFGQGEKSGLAAIDQKMDAVMKRHAEAVVELGRLKAALYAQVERQVVKLAIEVAKKIVHREVQVDRDIIQTLVHVTLAHVAEKTPAIIHVNPADYTYLSERQSELSQAEARNISLVSDKSIERGGCLVETDYGDIDARLEEKFHEVEQAFFEGAS